MVDLATVEAGIAIAEAIVNAIVKVSPAIIKGTMSATPYVQAIAGLVSGNNVTQAEIDATLAAVNAASAEFDTPLPPDDGTTTT